MNTYKILIPKPCTEDWGKMTQTKNGKTCASCNKVVIDFSNMNDQEIMEILLKNKGKRVCGNFFNTQIEKPIHYITQKKYTKWPAIAAMLVAGLFQLTTGSLNAQNPTKLVAYHKEARFETNTQLNTEPGKDSTIVYSLKVVSKEGEYAIPTAFVMIEGIGEFTSDINGMVTFSIAEEKIPNIIHIKLSAIGFNDEDFHLQKAKLTKTKNIDLWMTESERYMLRGDVSIEDSH